MFLQVWRARLDRPRFSIITWRNGSSQSCGDIGSDRFATKRSTVRFLAHMLMPSCRRILYQSGKASTVVSTSYRFSWLSPSDVGSETTQHILQCTQSLDSIKPGGAGHASSIRVRLLHAAVRQRIVKLAQQRPEYYNVEALGIPINDLDCIATIGTFSATLIWLSLPRQGIWMKQQEIDDYIALWRYIAYLTGTPTEPFETPEKAKKIMEVLLLHEIQPTETSKILANNIIKCLAAQPPSFASESFLNVNARFLNGNELCDALGLGKPSLYYWALAAGQCFFFMFICYTYRSIPSLDRRKIAVSRFIPQMNRAS